VYILISEGQRNDINCAIPLLDHIDIKESRILADKGYDSHQLIDYIYDRGGEPTIPSRKGLNMNVIAIGGTIKNVIWWNGYS